MRKRKIIRFLLYFAGSLIALSLALWIIYLSNTRISEPEVDLADMTEMTRSAAGDGYSCEHGWLRKAGGGWWLMHVEGTPYQMGYAHGLLAEELMAEQEAAFTARLAELIPSRFYQRFLLAFVRYFNRDLDDYVLPEFREEIYGVSRKAPGAYDFIAPAYARMLNYHAAHDLGHALQNMNLVACTAFGAWNGHTADSGMIIGRNFDFYISDDFARNKILLFATPDSGYRFVSVTWAGFTGVVSGMNEKGLTVSLNAAKSSIPLGARTPVSLLAREILQYASNIAEAEAIARKRETFVAESFLVGSVADGKAVIIEKSPELTSVFDPAGDHILQTNHFQSEAFASEELNLANIKNETSFYRLQRLQELVGKFPAMTVAGAAEILRDPHGFRGEDIGLGNERAVNQFIAHHSVIFRPGKQEVWIAFPPWQLGEYRLFDARSGEPDDDAIAPDTLLAGPVFRSLMKYRELASNIESGEFHDHAADSLIRYNPRYFHTYRILGDYFRKNDEPARADHYYRIALGLLAPSAAERNALTKSMNIEH
jgi:hypothetical protein